MADTPDGRREKKTRLSRKAGATLDFLAGGGEMERRIRAFDWSRTGLGPLEGWPQSLKTALKIALNSRYPIWMGWGQELINLYNDPYIPVLGKRDDWALGASARDVWKEIWEEHLGPQADAVLLRGEASWNDQRQMVMYRNGYAEETYFTFSYSAIEDDGEQPGGVFVTVAETTHRVLSARRLQCARDLGVALGDVQDEAQVCSVVQAALARNSADIPFALLYTLHETGQFQLSQLIRKDNLACGHQAVGPESGCQVHGGKRRLSQPRRRASHPNCPRQIAAIPVESDADIDDEGFALL